MSHSVGEGMPRALGWPADVPGLSLVEGYEVPGQEETRR